MVIKIPFIDKKRKIILRNLYDLRTLSKTFVKDASRNDYNKFRNPIDDIDLDGSVKYDLCKSNCFWIDKGIEKEQTK